MVCIQYDVREDLLYLVRIEHRFGQPGVEIPDDVDVFEVQLILPELYRAIQYFVNVRVLPLRFVLSGEGKKVLDDLPHLVR